MTRAAQGILVDRLDEFPRLRAGAEGHLVEDVGERPVIDLGPAVGRVLVALGAFEPHAEERGRHLLAPLLQLHRPLAAPEQVERLAILVGVVEAALDGLVLLGDQLDPLLGVQAQQKGPQRQIALQVVRHPAGCPQMVLHGPLTIGRGDATQINRVDRKTSLGIGIASLINEGLNPKV